MKSKLVSLLYGSEIEDKIVVAFERMQQIRGIADKDEAAAFALSLIADLVGFEDGVCMLISQEGTDLYVAAALGESATPLLGKRVSSSDGIVGDALRKSEVVAVSDAACAPIQREGKTFGAIELSRGRLESGFDQTCLKILSYVAGALAEHIDESHKR